MLLNWLLDVHVPGYQSYVDPPCYSIGHWMYMSRDISHMLIPHVLNWLLDVHVTGYQSYVDPHVTQQVIRCTCPGISVIC